MEEAKAAVDTDENNFSERFKVAEQFNFPTEANFGCPSHPPTLTWLRILVLTSSDHRC